MDAMKLASAFTEHLDATSVPPQAEQCVFNELRKPTNDSSRFPELPLQKWVAERLAAFLVAFGINRESLKTEQKGGVRYVKAFGKDFCPDMAVIDGDNELVLGVEVKLVSPKAVTRGVQTALGQAVMYRLGYFAALATLFVPAEVADAARTVSYQGIYRTSLLQDQLKPLGIFVVVKKLPSSVWTTT